jgi:Domain of unknown function (DUF4440)
MRCDQEFESTQRLYKESFATFDADTFRRIHHPEAVAILPGGDVRRGVEPMMAALTTHFERREAVCTWKELHRFVDDCRMAHILYETVYEIPSKGITIRGLAAVTHVHERGRWLVVADQTTTVDP